MTDSLPPEGLVKKVRLRMLRILSISSHNLAQWMSKTSTKLYGVSSWSMGRHFYLWTGRRLSKTPTQRVINQTQPGDWNRWN